MSAKKGVLLIHGFTGSPHEFLPVDPLLREAGHFTRRVTLPGHGDAPERPLHKVSAEEILAHCQWEYEQLAREVDHISVVGHSLGGACSLLIAAERPSRLQGVVAFSTPYEHAYLYNYWQGLAKLPLFTLLRGLYLAPSAQFNCLRPRCLPWHVPRLLQQSQLVFNWMQERVHQVDVPVHLAHSEYDLTIPFREMEKLADVIGRANEQVTLTTLTQSGHRLFPASSDAEIAHQIILDFLEAQQNNALILPGSEELIF